jgi:hypothetical protein
MKNLSKKQILSICDNVLGSLRAAKKNGTIAYVDGLIKSEIQNIRYCERYEIDITFLIPEFTLQNAIIMANAEPDEVDGSLWWNGTKSYFDYDNRIKFMEFIKECYQNK